MINNLLDEKLLSIGYRQPSKNNSFEYFLYSKIIVHYISICLSLHWYSFFFFSVILYIMGPTFNLGGVFIYTLQHYSDLHCILAQTLTKNSSNSAYSINSEYLHFTSELAKLQTMEADILQLDHTLKDEIEFTKKLLKVTICELEDLRKLKVSQKSSQLKILEIIIFKLVKILSLKGSTKKIQELKELKDKLTMILSV